MGKSITLTIRNHTGRSKGDFIIMPHGLMSPATRNPSIWGKVNASLVPKEILCSDQFKFSKESTDGKAPEYLSAFFKFQQSDFKTFAEYAGMNLAFCFGEKTSYNCPSRLDIDEPSIQQALSEISHNDTIGSTVFSMLGDNERLFSLALIYGKEADLHDVNDYTSIIDNFFYYKMRNSIDEIKGDQEQIKRDFLKQYLFRDAFGDVDFSLRNSGIIYNDETKQANIAGHFDFGEMFGVLYASKLTKPELTDINVLPEYMRNNPKFVEPIENGNKLKLEKYNMSPYDLGLNFHTYGNDSINNIKYISKEYPDVLLEFLTKLRNFRKSNYLEMIIKESSGDEIRQLLTPQEQRYVIEYLNGKLDGYEKTLVEELQNSPRKIFVKKHEKEILGEDEKEQENS